MISLQTYEEQRHQVVRDGFALDIALLVARGKLDRQSAREDLLDLLHDGPSRKAEELLQTLQRSRN